MMYKLTTGRTNLAHFATRFGAALRPQGFVYESTPKTYVEAQRVRDSLIRKGPTVLLPARGVHMSYTLGIAALAIAAYVDLTSDRMPVWTTLVYGALAIALAWKVSRD